MSGIEQTTIEERKQAIQSDIEKLEKNLTEIGEQQKQIQANLFALHGALQQCDQFIEMIGTEKQKDG